jgi:hypothetical protein
VSGINDTLLKIANATLNGEVKKAFVPMPGGGGGAPVDPMAMMGGGGAPPMDPGMMPAAAGMDPAAAMAGAGMPVDPAMAMAGGAEGAAPVDPMTGMPMDPAAAGGDPAAAGGAEQPPIDPALQAAIDEAVSKATGGAGGGAPAEGKPKSGGKVDPEAFAAMQADMSEMKGMLQKAIGFLMGTGQLPAEDAAPQMGEADQQPPAEPIVPPTSEKEAKFIQPPSDELVRTLADLLI